MTILLIILVAIAVIAGIFLLWAAGAYNGFVRLSALVDEAWSGIDVQLKRRYDLIPNLVSTVEGYSVHERAIFERIAQARAAAMGATTVEGKAQAEAGLTGALKSLFAVAENYPDLKASQNFLSLQHQLSTIEQEVQLARRYYNGACRNYNTRVASVPASLIASISGFKIRPYFEMSDVAQREAPSVSFKH